MNAKINTQMNVDEGSDPLSGVKSIATVSNSANSPHLSAAGSSTLAAERPSRPPATWQQLSSGDSGTLTLMIVGPNGSKTPLKIRVSDDVSTLRALVTQMYCTCSPSVSPPLSPNRIMPLFLLFPHCSTPRLTMREQSGMIQPTGPLKLTGGRIGKHFLTGRTKMLALQRSSHWSLSPMSRP